MKRMLQLIVMKRKINIPISDQVNLDGELAIPDGAKGLVIFSHGSGSSRFSPRNNMVAEYLRKNKFGTVLFDLLTEYEDEDYANRFDIQLLTTRLKRTTEWLMKQETTPSLPMGYFGASTGAASALKAAALLAEKIKAVVSRGGRPDLAIDELAKVTAPTLLIVGGLDFQVIEMNKRAYDELPGTKELKIVNGATHLFEEPGKLEEVADLANQWYQKYLK